MSIAKYLVFCDTFKNFLKKKRGGFIGLNKKREGRRRVSMLITHPQISPSHGFLFESERINNCRSKILIGFEKARAAKQVHQKNI